MVIRGEALIQNFTFGFTIHGQRNDWHVTVTAPGDAVDERETRDATWFPLLNEMLAAASENASAHKNSCARRGTAMTITSVALRSAILERFHAAVRADECARKGNDRMAFQGNEYTGTPHQEAHVRLLARLSWWKVSRKNIRVHRTPSTERPPMADNPENKKKLNRAAQKPRH